MLDEKKIKKNINFELDKLIKTAVEGNIKYWNDPKLVDTFLFS